MAGESQYGAALLEALVGVIALAGLVVVAGLLSRRTRNNQDAGRAGTAQFGSQSSTLAAMPRQPDAIYQKGKIVARVLDPEVDEQGREVQFGEVYKSDYLLLPDECEYQKYVLLVRRIASATIVHPESLQKGRILKGVTAEILRYREQ